MPSGVISHIPPDCSARLRSLLYDYQNLSTELKGERNEFWSFALYIDQTAGGGGNALSRRVIPLPPTSGGDAINFSQGRLSLAYDDFDSDAMASVRIHIINNEGIRVDQQLQFGRGLTLVSQILPGDVCASFEIQPSTAPGGPALLSRYWLSTAIEEDVPDSIGFSGKTTSH